jgi:hypothetical protein
MIMRLWFVQLAAVVCGIPCASHVAYACSCGGSYPWVNAWEAAKLKAQNATAVFEGVPERLDWQWSILNAKERDLIPADAYGIGQPGKHWPRMVVTFRVQKVYKGDLGPKVDVTTGIVTMDCSGRRFSIGMSYLVYGLAVGLCSPGGWIENSELATELRYLRKERPIRSDIQGPRSLPNDFEEGRRRYFATTGKICGTVVPEGAEIADRGSVAFLSAAGYSPYDLPSTGVNQDGSFCSYELDPGKYYLYFTGSSDGRRTSGGYYPLVGDRTKAQSVEISAGQTRSGIVFKVPAQETHPVRGFISIDHKSTLMAGDVRIALIRLDGAPREAWYEQEVDLKGSFLLSSVKYFHFDNVLPGRYMAYVSVLRQGWYTRKAEVNVSTHMKFILLELARKK